MQHVHSKRIVINQLHQSVYTNNPDTHTTRCFGSRGVTVDCQSPARAFFVTGRCSSPLGTAICLGQTASQLRCRLARALPEALYHRESARANFLLGGTCHKSISSLLVTSCKPYDITYEDVDHESFLRFGQPFTCLIKHSTEKAPLACKVLASAQ